MTQFVKVATLDDIVAGAAAVVTVGETTVARFEVNGRLYAVEDGCMRCGSSIAAGLLAGAEITCNGCSWRYDVTTGAVKGVQALRGKTFEVKTVGAHVMVAESGSADPKDP